jgi:8-oxo-dGTP diphosphatase
MEYPRVGVALILEKQGRVLLVQRKGAHGEGTWSTPGGHLEFGETPAQCAIRETTEEVGVEADNPAFVAITNDVFLQEGKHYITIWMKTNDFAGDPYIAAKREVAEIKWFEWEDLPAHLFLPLQNLLNQKGFPAVGLAKPKE